MILGIEGTISMVANGTPYSEMDGVTLLKRLFTVWMRHGLQPVFCRDREELAWFIRHTYEAIGRVTQ